MTDRLIDYEAKLKNLLALRDRIRYLIENKSDSSNIVDMERELSRVQGELDSLQGQMETLKKRVAYSTLDLIVQQKRIYGPLGYLAHGAWWAISKLFVIR